jgi:hypothetical protein
MTTDATPANVGSNDGLGPAPARAEVDALMKRCQIGVGGRHALDNARSIMAECYGTLGALMLTVERLSAWIEGDCMCPCCEQTRACVDGCTFDEDDPSGATRMAEARAALYGA